MAEKVENALNETRILVLVVQVLIGFQLQSAFSKGFEKLPYPGQLVLLACLGMQLVSLALLLLPPSYHRIVDEGWLSTRLCRLTTSVVGIALVLLAVPLGLQFATVTAPVIGRQIAIEGGAFLGLLALFSWWGIELLARQRSKPKGLNLGGNCQEDRMEDSPLPQKIKFALTETRVVLPGAQALLGFQFICILNESFARLPESLQRLHLLSLVAVAISAIFLMAPAAYHRIVEQGESTDPVLQFTSNMLLAAMVFLGLGLALDVVVVVHKVIHDMFWSIVAGGLTLAGCYALWFGYTLYARATPSGRVIDASKAQTG